MRAAWTKLAWKVLSALGMTLVVILAMAWLAGAFHRGKIGPGAVVDDTRPAAGAVYEIRPVERVREAEVVGSVQSESRTGISARIVANIIEMRVQAGDRVKAGDVLAVLDDAAPRARVEQARELLRAAQASRTLAQTELDRVATLRASGAVSRNQIDEWETRKSVAEADAARAGQAIREAEVGLQDAVLRAPFDGVVIDRAADPGEQAFAGRVLVTLYDPSRLRLEANVPESYIGQLHAGQKLDVVIEAAAQQRAGVVQQIVPASDPESRSFLVKVHLDDPSGLYPGMYGRLRVPLGNERRIEIPRSAVTQVGQLSFVRVVEGDRASRRAVRLGRVENASVEILSGLHEGERVAVGN